jgi:hypothetical protein
VYSDYKIFGRFQKAIKDSKYPSLPESVINISGKFYLIKVKTNQRLSKKIQYLYLN